MTSDTMNGTTMNRRRFLAAAAATGLVGAAGGARAAVPQRFGVTLHPYYSYVANVVGNLAEVVPIIPSGFNPHAYEPRPEDILRIGSLDAIVLNGIGHDDFAGRMIAASSKPALPVVEANADVPLLPAAGSAARASGKVVNPHTFLSITGAVLQVATIARELGRLDPANAESYAANARAYSRRLRLLRADALGRLASAGDARLRVATIHGAYDYLLREFGLEVAAVVEPAHGIEPSPAQLAETIRTMRALDVQVIFSELNFPSAYVDTIRRETGIRLYAFSHIAHGDYAADLFEREMTRNMDTLVQAMLEAKP
ncbi:metal ABC transporter solute-binding protein, Zn/Mn family [Azospirillum doebereinerae]|uniref:metal ABC transporter solute-binding protein, Zn/Mn family n=1 Tax=Azospirillum doebereinerae TaxID=92933 RepID=UPI001EE5B55F|nr:zinc ABC transporter substrate-binding protein [Azospirillum doebereinerae]MCG5241850.1 zinc ABC transporter substrate-binding protein [Azospirillum doebereinerae]